MDITLHGSSVRHSHFDLTMWYMACFCLKSPSPNNLQPWCLTSRCTTGLLTLVFLPFDFSCASICHPPKGPNCGSRPHCHLPVWNQRKPSARCLLAEGGKSGKSKQSHTNQCVETIVSFFIAALIVCCASGVNTQCFVWIHFAVCTIVEY